MADSDAPKPRGRKPRETMPGSPNAVDIAMVTAASGRPLPEVARRLLEEQAELLHAQRTELKYKHIGEMVRAALWAILAVVAFLFLALVVSLVLRAARSDTLIVESFRVPPAMAQQGLTGDVVATQVLDKIAEFQEQTESIRAASSYDNNWGNDLKIDIPQTGATVEQVWKLLRGWLGKETRISGEVIQTKDGLALTTRVGASPGQRYVDKNGDLDSLITKGAESIFKTTQPYRYGVYLLHLPKRESEGFESLKALSKDPSAMERKWAYNGMSWYLRTQGQFAAAIPVARKAVAIDPYMIPALSNMAYPYLMLGHTQSYVDIMEREWPLTTKPNKEYDERVNAANNCAAAVTYGSVLMDPMMVEQGVACEENALQSYSVYAPYDRASLALLRNDPAPALAFQKVDGLDEAEANWQVADLHLRAEMMKGPSPALAAALAAFEKADEAMRTTPYARAAARTSTIQAEAASELGLHSEAHALIEQTPLDCYDCVRVRGLVARRAGDLAGAQRWLLRAAKQGPRLAPAFLDWARLLLDARHYATAEPKLKRAAKLAPNWADPLKYWGDLLTAEGKPKEALAKYDAALKLAPKWQQLKAARARVAG